MEVFYPLQLFCDVLGSLLALPPKNGFSLEAEIHLLQPVSHSLHTVIKAGEEVRWRLIMIYLHKHMTQQQ